MLVKVSPKFQVVIPEEVRQALGLKAGARVDVILKGGIAYIVPLKSVSSLTSKLKGRLSEKANRRADRTKPRGRA